MVLVERGLVDLDEPINTYLPASAQLVARAGSADDVTVRRVANHSSGLPLHFNMFYQEELDAGLRPSRDATIRQYAQTVSRPGEGWQYSNLGFGLLDRVISHLAASDGQGGDAEFGRFLQREVLDPLGLAHTAVGHLDEMNPALAALAALRYTEGSVSGDLDALEDYDSDHPGAAAVWSSVRDVLRFGEFHCAAHLPQAGDDDSSVLSKEARLEMHRSTAPSGEPPSADDPAPGYGVGWMVTPHADSGHHILHHGGGMHGVSTMLMIEPTEQVVVAVLANSRGPPEEPQPTTAVAEQVLRDLLPNYTTAPPPPAATVLTDSALGAELGGRWAGHVLLPADGGETASFRERGLALEVDPASGAVVARLQPPEPSMEAATASELAAAEPSPLIDGRIQTPLSVYADGARMLCGYFELAQGDSLGTADADRRPHELHLTLRLREGGVLAGGVTAMLEQQSGYRAAPRYPNPRSGNAVTHWAELRRQD